MKKRVAHLIATNFYGGPERQILNHSIRLIEKEVYDPLIISFREKAVENQLLKKAAEKKVDFAFIEKTGVINPKSIMELKSILQKAGVDILVSHGFKANVIGRITSRLVGIPMIAVSRGWTGESLKISFYEKLDKLFLRWAEHIVAVSEGQREKILNLRINEKRVSVIHNAIDVNAMPSDVTRSIRKELHIPEPAVLVATAGRLSPEKDQRILIEAAKTVIENHSNIYFCIFGDGPCKLQLEKKIAEYNLGARFFLPGFREDFLSFLREIDIFLLPSLTEGLPNVILEAYACCIPVIATSVGGTPEIIISDKIGYLIEPGDTENLARKVIELAKNEGARREMGRVGYQNVKNRFDYNNQTNKYIDLYNRILSSD